MSIDEIDARIFQIQELIKQQNKVKKDMNKSKGLKLQKDKDSKPVEEELKKLRMENIRLLVIKDQKIPVHEKLPKDSQFYKHYMQNE
jgi:hypothetical protein